MPCTRAITGCGMRVMRQHHAAALGEQLVVVLLARIGAHLLQIVTGAESRPVAGDHHHAHRFVLPDRIERGLQFGQQLLGQRVVLLRPVQREGGDPTRSSAQQKLLGDGRSQQLRWCSCSENSESKSFKSVNAY